MWHDGSTMVSDYELFGIMYDYGLSCTPDGRTIYSYNEFCMWCIELHGYAVLGWVMYIYVTLCDMMVVLWALMMSYADRCMELYGYAVLCMMYKCVSFVTW